MRKNHKQRHTGKDALGEGTFGYVRRCGNVAIKTFSEGHHMIQELILTKYLDKSPMIVSCVGYDFKTFEMKMELCETSLKDALDPKKGNRKFTFDEKMKIFTDVVHGLNHIHSRDIVHADLKPSNILLNFNPLSAKICDLGLSSTNGYGKVRQTGKVYRMPDEIIDEKNGFRHDIYSCTLFTIEMFAGLRFETQIYPQRLAEIVSEFITPIDAKLSKVLKRCALEGGVKYMAYNILLDMTGVAPSFGFDVIPIIENRLSSDDVEYIRSTMMSVGAKVNARRLRRGVTSIIDILNILGNRVVQNRFKLYTVAMIMILCAVFGERSLHETGALQLLGERYSRSDLYTAVSNIIDCNDGINLLMLV